MKLLQWIVNFLFRRRITQRQLDAFAQWLRDGEKKPGTIQNYLRNVRNLSSFLGDRCLNKTSAIAWKDYLIVTYKPGTVNTMLAGVNQFFKYLDWTDLQLKALRIQANAFIPANRTLAYQEVMLMVNKARELCKDRIAYIMQTLGGAGLRVSELQYITVESLKLGEILVQLKGKIRRIILPDTLRINLLDYAKKQKIASGEIFLTRSGKRISRQQVWSEMKAIAALAGVNPEKVFPHNLRHMFARDFYAATKDIAKLADVLGHSSIATTRIYLATPWQEHQDTVNNLHSTVA